MVTDNLAIQFIYNGSRGRSQARIERWGLRLSSFDFEVVHRPGKSNIADILSRHPDPEDVSPDGWLTDEFVSFVAENAITKMMTREQILSETLKDPLLSFVKLCLSKRFLNREEKAKLGVFYNLRDELALTREGLLLRDRRIVLPHSLHKVAVEIAHEGHLGIVKTKALLRSKVWFAGLNQLVENKVGGYMICQCCTSNKGLKNPVSMARMSDKVWDEISIDFFGPLPSGEYCLVLTDDSSRYKAVKIVRSTGTDSTVGRLDEVHTVLGIPSVIRADNGPPFNGRAFRKYCDSLGIKHRKITPLWPRTNGKCERFMQQLSKVVTGSHIAKKNWREELNVFLRSYNCSPHSVTGVAPVELMFNRTNFTKLPSYDIKSQDWDNNLKKAMDNELKSNETRKTIWTKGFTRNKVQAW